MLRALRRQPVDQLPTQSNYTRAMGRLLCGHFGISAAELPDRLGNHLLRVDIDHPRPTNADGSIEFDWWGAGWDTRTEGYWHAFSPLGDSLDLDRYPWPNPDDAILSTARRTILRDGADYFIAPNLGMCLFERALSLRGFDALLMDMVERPEWVEQKIREINEVWFTAYQLIYDLIKLEDGSSTFGAFYIWGPGKVAKLQCDASAMFSPKMYQRFVVPALTAQCEWLDHSLYHLDGTQAMVHLDTLLAIKPLDAIEWTPQAGIETGGHKRWHDLYRRILAAGKSVQVVNVEPDEVLPLLDAIGRKGVYMLIQFKNEREAEQVLKLVEPYY